MDNTYFVNDGIISTVNNDVSISDTYIYSGDLNTFNGILNTPLSTAFFDKDNNEVLKFTPDGEIFWRGKLIEMDSEFKQAVFDIRRLLILNGFRNL